ncbi:AIR synthase-related protein, partial [Enterococcus lactis]|uniref:AIR synthase-related protein n=1 Tax=Enterococcus lactis TaxID=357441 RepID=UPI0031CD8EA6
ADITGGGFVEKIPRMLPESMAAEIKLGTWPILPNFGCLQKYREIPMMEIYEIFKMGIGMVLAVEEAKVKELVHESDQAGEKVNEIGKVIHKEKHSVE